MTIVSTHACIVAWISLEVCFQNAQQIFTIKDVSLIAIQAITRIQAFHETGFIHRDIKPDNILFGSDEEANKLFLIDFGLAKMYMQNYHKVGLPPGKHHHINFEEGKSLIGTPRYCSINAASGKEQSRRDDLESLGYVLAYLLRGNRLFLFHLDTTPQQLERPVSFVSYSLNPIDI